ncbi:MAG: hypothetical protein DWQ10_03630 [Calditrichaeota bacterium]|nr:MAG: hypothetical protein DWQ10_03630 [Calditrichota bacterium]
MKSIFESIKESPLELLEKLANTSAIELNDVNQNATKTNDKLLLRFSHVLQHYWELKKILVKQPFDEYSVKAVTIHLKTIEALFDKMDLSIYVTQIGEEVTDEVTKIFDPITFIPNTENDKILVDKIISPAVLYKEKVALKGTIQILKPIEKQQNNSIDNLEDLKSIYGEGNNEDK